MPGGALRRAPRSPGGSHAPEDRLRRRAVAARFVRPRRGRAHARGRADALRRTRRRGAGDAARAGHRRETRRRRLAAGRGPALRLQRPELARLPEEQDGSESRLRRRSAVRGVQLHRDGRGQGQHEGPQPRTPARGRPRHRAAAARRQPLDDRQARQPAPAPESQPQRRGLDAHRLRTGPLLPPRQARRTRRTRNEGRDLPRALGRRDQDPVQKPVRGPGEGPRADEGELLPPAPRQTLRQRQDRRPRTRQLDALLETVGRAGALLPAPRQLRDALHPQRAAEARADRAPQARRRRESREEGRRPRRRARPRLRRHAGRTRAAAQRRALRLRARRRDAPGPRAGPGRPRLAESPRADAQVHGRVRRGARREEPHLRQGARRQGEPLLRLRMRGGLHEGDPRRRRRRGPRRPVARRQHRRLPGSRPHAGLRVLPVRLQHQGRVPQIAHEERCLVEPREPEDRDVAQRQGLERHPAHLIRGPGRETGTLPKVVGRELLPRTLRTPPVDGRDARHQELGHRLARQPHGQPAPARVLRQPALPTRQGDQHAAVRVLRDQGPEQEAGAGAAAPRRRRGHRAAGAAAARPEVRHAAGRREGRRERRRHVRRRLGDRRRGRRAERRGQGRAPPGRWKTGAEGPAAAASRRPETAPRLGPHRRRRQEAPRRRVQDPRRAGAARQLRAHHRLEARHRQRARAGGRARRRADRAQRRQLRRPRLGRQRHRRLRPRPSTSGSSIRSPPRFRWRR